MSPGYSTEIYKNRKVSILPFVLLIAVVLTVSVIIFLNITRKAEKPSGRHLIATKPVINEQVPDNSATKVVENVTSNEIQVKLPEIQNNTNSNKISRDELLSIQNRALFFAKRKEYDKAIYEYNILLKYNKRFLTIIGMCYYWMDENGEAVSALKKADLLEYYPYRTKKFLALAYYRLNDLEISLEYAEDALDYGSDAELKQLITKLKREENVMKGYKDLGIENFLIQFSREEHDETRIIVSDYLKEAYKEIGKEFDYFPNRQFVVILYNERDFFDVTRAPGWAGGMYDGKIRLPIKGLTGPDSILRKVIFHEYTHALVSDITKKCPLWINEGLAEYFSSDEKNINVPNPIPLKLLGKRFPSGNISYISLAYRTSHNAVKYLIERYGIYSIMELLENFGKGMDVNSAFESVLFITYDDFVAEWGNQQ